MAEPYTPTTDEAREAYSITVINGDVLPERAAEFDRWLASVKADVWDEGVLLLADRHNISVGPDWLRLSNPYRIERGA